MGLIQEKCHHPGCNNLQTSSNNNYKGQKGVKYYRKWCQQHYEERRAANAGLAKSEYAFRVKLNAAKNAGFNTITEYLNSKHPYRKHRKDYCENIDGRLGFKCNYPKTPFKEVSALLQVDHIDGNPNKNDPRNLQTLCPNCHTYKTHINEDNRSPGRKALL